MPVTRYKRQILTMLSGGTLLGALFVYTAPPVNSVSTVQLSGSAASSIALSAGNPVATPVTAAPGVTDTSSTVAAANTADGFNDTVNFGTLSNGDGSNEVATLSFRERGNATCHVSCSVSAYTANNIAYNGTPLVGSATSAAQLSFVTLGRVGATAGAQGNLGNVTYGSQFTSGTGTLASLNAGTMGAVATGSAQFVTFSGPPSSAGGLTSATNWVEDTATFSVPTGMAWSPVGATAPFNWSTTVQFGIFPLP
jgi:hypothetical protein